MQATYYQYYLTQSGQSGDRYSVDIRPFLNAYCSWAAPKFKSSFTHVGDHLYLTRILGNRFLFIHARDKEIIKTIDPATNTVDEIQKKLNGASLGFASYVIVDEDYYAIACKQLSPRSNAFSTYIDDLFHRLGLPIRFHSVAMTHQVDRAAISKLVRVGRVNIELNRENTYVEKVLEMFTTEMKEKFEEVGSIEISFVPKDKRGNIKKFLESLSDVIGSNGIEDFEARAITEVADKVMDVYFVGEGTLKHSIAGVTEAKILDSFEEQANGKKMSKLLREKLKKMRSDDGIKKGNFPDLDRLAEPTKWPNDFSVVT